MWGCDLRANNGKNESAPGQVAAVVRSVGIIPENTRNTLCLITSSWASRTTIRSSENRHSNKTSNKGNIQKDPEPAKPSRTTTLEKQRQDHGDKSVQGSCGEDTFNRAKGSADAMSGLDDIDNVVDFLETGGEKAEGDDRGKELSNTCQAEKPTVEARVLELIGDEASQETRWALRRAAVVVVSGVVVVRHGEDDLNCDDEMNG